jgi:hypothetical protein
MWRWAHGMGPATMPVVMGEGLKPLTTSQTPSDSSHRKIGAVAIAANTVTGSLPRNSVAVAETDGDEGLPDSDE